MKLLGTNPLGGGLGFAPGAGLCALLGRGQAAAGARAETHAGTGWR